MTEPIRVPLAQGIGSRDGSFDNIDPYIFNGYIEAYKSKLFVRKRPGTAQRIIIADGTDQAFFYFNGLFYAVISDVLYVVSVAGNAGTSGATFTQSAVPPWAATGAGTFRVLVFNDRLWVMGGVFDISGNITGIVYSSTDGVKWQVATAGAGAARGGHGVCVLNGSMFMIGGFTTGGVVLNDVISTPDGTNWTTLTSNAPWSPRSDMGVIAANNGIYVFGGATVAGSVNDVWFSPDGATWNLVTVAAAWSARNSMGTAYFNNLLWVVGGLDSGGVSLNDVWSSPDGLLWTQTTAAAFATGRNSLACFSYGAKIWALGGANSALTPNSDVYNSSDGITWSLVTSAPGWAARYDLGAIPFRTPRSVSQFRYPTIWVMGGFGFFAPDVWRGDLDTALLASYALSPDVANKPYSIETYMNGTKLVIKNTSNFWVLDSGTLIKVVDPSYPTETVPGVVVLNAFVHVMTPTGEIHSCQLDDALTWPSLQFVTADYEDDPGVYLAKYLNYVCALGQYTTQFFYDNGANQPEGSPLAPYLNANLRVGCFNPASVVQMYNTLVWVAQDEEGRLSVMMLNALVPQSISNPFVERILQRNAGTSGLFTSVGLAIEGYEFYVLNIGFAASLVYDFAAKEWYEWSLVLSFTSSSFEVGRIATALKDGNIIQISELYPDDKGTPFDFSVQTLPIDGGNRNNKFFGRLTLVGDVSPATPHVRWSDDDYQTFSAARTVDMSLPRPDLTRLGAAKRRAFIVTQSDSNPARWEALELTVSQGEA